MNTNDFKLMERGFWDSLLDLGRDTPAASPSASGVEAKARQDFTDKMNMRAMSAFSNAFKNQGIDVSKSFGSGQNSSPQPSAGGQSNTAPASGGQSNTAPASGGQSNAAPASGGQSNAAPASGGQSNTAPASGQQAGANATTTPSAAGQKKPGFMDKVKGFFGKGAAQPGAAQPGQPAAAGTKPATAQAAKSKAPSNAAVPTGQKQGAAKPQVDVNVDKIVGGMRKLQPAGTKPLPAVMKKKKDPTTGKMVKVRIPTTNLEKEIVADLGKVSTNKDYLIRTGDKILKLANAGYDVKNLHQQWMGQYAKGAKAKTIQEWLINELEFLADSKYLEWDRMLMEQTTGVSPGDYMLPIIKQMLKGYNLEKSPNFDVVKNALVAWEKAFKQQMIKSGNKFAGKFDSSAQQAWDNLMSVVADTAFASLAAKDAGSGQGAAQQPATQP